MHAITSIFAFGSIVGVLIVAFVLGRCSANGRRVPENITDSQDSRDNKQRTNADIDRAATAVGQLAGNNKQSADDNRRLTEGCEQSADLIREGKEILEEAWKRG